MQPYSTSRVPTFREMEGATISPVPNNETKDKNDRNIAGKLGMLKKTYGPFGIFNGK